jgi:ABC-type amino acid transport substrate-binding protein
MEEEGFTVDFVFMDTDDDPLEYVRNGRADLSMDGGIYLARGMEVGLEGIEISPFKPDLVTIGWALSKDDALLRSILSKIVATALGDGTFGRIWEENMGVGFEFYLDLISE